MKLYEIVMWCAPFLISMPPSNDESPAPGHSVSEAKMVLWSIQMLEGTPDDMPSIEIVSASLPPGSRPKVMFRTMTLDDGPAMWMPKLAEEPLSPMIVMSFFFLICTIWAAFFHCAQTSVIVPKLKTPV